MSDLFNSVTSFLEREPAVQAVKNGLGIPSNNAATSAIGLSIPTMLGNLSTWAEGSMGSTWLTARLPAVGPQSLDDFEALNRAPDFQRFGISVIDIVLGNQRKLVVRQISRRASVTEHAADTILGGTTWVVMARLAEQHRPYPQRDDLVKQLRAEHDLLVSVGWGSWLDATVVAVADDVIPVPQQTAETVGHADSGTPSWARSAVYPAPTTSSATLDRPGLGTLMPQTASPRVEPSPQMQPTVRADQLSRTMPANGPVLQTLALNSNASKPLGESAKRDGRPDPESLVPRDRLVTYQSRSTLAGQPNLYGDGHPAHTQSIEDSVAHGVLGTSDLSILPVDAGQGTEDEPNRALRLLPWIVGAIGLAVLAGGMFLWMTETGSDQIEVASSGEDADSSDITNADLATTSDVAASTQGDVNTSASTSQVGEVDLMPSDSWLSVEEVLSLAADRGAAVEGGVATVAPSMADPLGKISATSASIVTLDPKTGEVCHDFDIDGLGSPYDGHIHVGPAGVKGGIVVDFGSFDGSSDGCLSIEPVDVQAILADLQGHYVELHDADEVNTIRRQLADPDPNDPAVAVDASVDPETDGAVIVIEQGKLILRGNVPDQVTVDKFLATFGDIDFADTEVVNELVIVEGAPRPSGRITVNDSIAFAHNSSQITNPDATVLSDLAMLFKARPAWRMTVIGHTDSKGSDVYNLELSLLRAASVRDALIERGVPAESLAIEGAGDTNPIGDNATAEGRAQNRRIELRVVAG